MTFGNVSISLDLFGNKDKSKFIALLLSGGVRKDLNGKWSEYKAAASKVRKKTTKKTVVQDKD